MNRAKQFVLPLGILATVLFSAWGLILVPDWQTRDLRPVTLDDGRTWPPERFGAAKRGRDVYIANGCVYCHSQQVRPPGYGVDQERGWGRRQTVPLDHLYDSPPLLGTMRTGPDLANIGVRQPDPTWHLLHLYDPQITSPGSTMPPHRFLFTHVQHDAIQRPHDALEIPETFAPPRAWVVPTRTALDLVAYLLSLDHGAPLPAAQEAAP